MSGQNRIDFTFGAKVDQASFKQVQNQLTNLLVTYNKESQKGGLTTELQNAIKAAQQLDLALNKSYNSTLGSFNMSTFNSAIQKSNTSVAELKKNLEQGGHGGATVWNNMASQILKTHAPMKKTNQMLDEMFKSLKNVFTYNINAGIFNRLTRELSHAVGFIGQLDKSLTDIRIVTGKSAEDMKDFAQWANQAGQNLSASTNDIAQASLIYAQQGDSDAQVKRKAEITTKVAAVTGQSTSSAADELTAIWNGYRVTEGEMEGYADKMAAVASKTASSFQELATGMQKVAASGNTVGVSFDQLNAQMSTIVAVTREAPESVGTALKTIYARMGDLKLDPNATDEFGTKLGDVTGKMQEMGVNVLDETGEIREMGEVIEEVGSKWQGWTRNQQEAAAVALAGKRQYTQLMALFNNWDKYISALEISQGAEGELNKQFDIYDDSLEAMENRFETAKEAIYQDLLDPEAGQSILQVFTEIANVVDRIVKGLGGGTTALMGFGVIAAKVFKTQLQGQVFDSMKNKAVQKQQQARTKMRQDVIAEKEATAEKSTEEAKAAKNLYTTKDRNTFFENKLDSIDKDIAKKQAAANEAESNNDTQEKERLEAEIKELKRSKKKVEVSRDKVAGMSEDDAAEYMKKNYKDVSTQHAIEDAGSEARYKTQLEYQERIDALAQNLSTEEREQLELAAEELADLKSKTAEMEKQNELIRDQYNIKEGASEEDVANKFQQERDNLREQLYSDESDEIKFDVNDNDNNEGIVKTLQDKGINVDSYVAPAMESISRTQDEINKKVQEFNKSIRTSDLSPKATKEDIEKQLTEMKVNREAALEGENGKYDEQISKLEEILKLFQDIDDTAEQANQDIQNTIQEHNETIRAQIEQVDQDEEDYYQNQEDIDLNQSQIKGKQEGLDTILGEDEKIQLRQEQLSSIIDLTMAVGTAITTVRAIGDIWSDDDLSTGEQIIQTLELSLPVLFSTFTALKGLKESATALALARRKSAAAAAVNAGAEVAEAGATTAAGVAAQGASVSFWEMAAAEAAALWPIALIVAALGLLAGAIYAVVQARSDNSRAAKEELDKQQAALESANQSVELTTKAYKDLKDTLEDLGSKRDALDSLKKGTQEWKDAVFELNTQMLELKDKYSGLELEMDANGVYSVTEESQNAVMQQMREQQDIAYAAKEQQQRDTNKAEFTYQASKLADELENRSVAITVDTQDVEDAIDRLSNVEFSGLNPENDANSFDLFSEQISEDTKRAILEAFGETVDGLSDEDVNSTWESLIGGNSELQNTIRALIQSNKDLLGDNKESYEEEARRLLADNNENWDKMSEEEREKIVKRFAKDLEYQDKHNNTSGAIFTTVGEIDAKGISAELNKRYGINLFRADGTISFGTGTTEIGLLDDQQTKEIMAQFLSAQYGANLSAKNIQIDEDGLLSVTGLEKEQTEKFGFGKYDNGTLNFGQDTADFLEQRFDDWYQGYRTVEKARTYNASQGTTEEVKKVVTDSDAKDKYELTPDQINNIESALSLGDYSQLTAEELEKLNQMLEKDELGKQIADAVNMDSADNVQDDIANQTLGANILAEEYDISIGDSKKLNAQLDSLNIQNQDAYKSFLDDNKQYASQIIEAYGNIDFTSPISPLQQLKEALGDTFNNINTDNLDALTASLQRLDNAATVDAATFVEMWTKIKDLQQGGSIKEEDYQALLNKKVISEEQATDYFNKNADGTYTLVVDESVIQDAVRQTVNVTSEAEAQEAKASTYTNVQDLLGANLSKSAINKGVETISANMIKDGKATTAELKQLEKAYITTHKAQIKAKKGSQEYKEELKEIRKNAKAAAVAQKQYTNALDEANKTWKDDKANLSKENKGKREYKDAAQNVRNTIAQLKGGKASDYDYLTDDWIANHRDTWDKVLQGDKEAYYSMMAEISKKGIQENDDLKNIEIETKLKGIGEFTNAVDFISSSIDMLKKKKIDPKAKVDITGFEQGCEQLIKSGAYTKEQLNEVFKGLGGSLQWEKVDSRTQSILSGLKNHGPSSEYNKALKAQNAQEVDGTFYSYKLKWTPNDAADTPYKPPVSTDSPSKSSSSGDKGKQAEKGGQKIKPEQDPYNHINAQLEDIDDKLSEIQSKAEHVSGKQYIQDLNKQNALLDKQMQLYRKKEKIANKVLKEDKADIQKYGKKLGVNVTSEDYDEDGNLKNVDSLRKKAAKKYNKALKKYKKKYGNKKKLKGNKLKVANKAKKKLDKYKDAYDDFDTAINEYQSDESERDEIRSLRQAALQQKIQNQIEAYTYKITATVDRQQLKKDIEDTRIQIETAFQDDDDYIGKLNSSIKTFTASMKFASSSMDNAATGLKHLATLMKGKQDNVYSAKDGKMSENFIKEATEQAKEYLDTYKSNLDEALSNAQTMWSSFLDTINNSTAKINDYSAALDNLNSIIDSMISVMEMFGNQEGANFLKELQKYQSQQAQSAKEQVKLYNDPAVLKSLQKNYDDYAKKAAEATDETYKQLYAQARDAAGQQLMDYRKMGAEKIADAAEKSIKVILTKYNQKIVEMFTFTIGGQEKTLQQIKEAYDWLQETSDRYLDDVNKQYSINSFKRAAEQALKDNESLTAQQRISAVYQQQLEILQSQDKLTQRQVDRANDLLQLELKRLALEEARDNKNKMKLRRDASGNYSYQYVADEEDVDKAQQEYDAAQNELYNKDKAEVKRLTDLVFSDLSGFQEGLKGLKDNTEIYDEKGNIINQEAYQKEYQKLIDQYAPHLADSMTSLNTMLGNLFSEEDIANWSNMTDEQKQSIAQSAGIDNVQLIDGLLNGTFGDLESITKWMTDGSSGLAAILGRATATTDDYFKMMEEHENETNEIIKSVFGDNSSVLTETKAILEQINGEHLANIAQAISALLQSYKEDYLPLMQEYLAYTRMQAAGVTGTATAVKDKDGNITGYTATGTSTSSSSKGGSVKYGNNHSFKYDSTKTTVNKTIDENGTVKTTGSNTKYMQKGGRFLIQNNQNHKVLEKSWSNGKIDKGDTPTITTNDKLYARVKQDGVKKGGKKKGSTEYKWQALPVSGIKGEKVTIASSNKVTAWGVNSKQDVKMVQIQSDHLGPYFGGTTLYIPEKYLQGFDTGGYTGEWVNGSAHDNGRLALLHQKEIVLNESDTSNLLKSIGMLRDMSGLLKSLDNSRNELFSRFMMAESRFTASAAPKDEKATVQQNVVINADFPNANNAIEIERALNNVMSTAWQQVGEL